MIKTNFPVAGASVAAVALMFLLGGAVTGCGGQKGTLQIDVVVSPVDDPFVDAKTVRITVGSSAHQKTFPVTGGHFTASVDLSPLSVPGTVRLDLFDAIGNLVAYGQTTVLALQAVNQEAWVWIGRPGRIVPAKAALGNGVTDAAATSIPGVGILIAGGRDSTRKVVDTAAIYLTLQQSIFNVTGLNAMRANAVAATIGESAVLFGGSQAPQFEATASPVPTAELFDPTAGQAGVWTNLPGDTVPPRSSPQLTALGAGDLLITGGYDGTGARVGTAAYITVGATQMLQNAAMAMVTPRGGHVACAATFADGAGALIVGGAATDDVSTVAERLVGQSFEATTLAGVENRSNATCTTLPSGKILLVGGYVAGVPVASGFVIDPSKTPPAVTLLPNALSAARARHTASLLSTGDVLICGGDDGNRVNVPTCDVINGTTYAIARTVNMTAPRRDHVASVLDTGQVLVTGGLSNGNTPLSSIEIYTP